MAEKKRLILCRRSLAGLALSVCVALAGGCAARSAADPSSAHLARTLEKQRQQESALAAAESRIPALREKMTAERYEHMGDLYLRQQNLTLAYINYNKALRLEPRRSGIRYKMGLLFLKKGLPEEAEGLFLELLKEDPRQAKAQLGLGRTYFVEGRIEESEAHLQIALELDDQLWEAHAFLGIIYNNLGQTEEALRKFAAAVALEPDSGMLYNNIGVSYLLARRYENAARAFEQAIKLGSGERKIYNNLALALGKMGRFDEALEVFRNSGDVAQAYNNIGYLYLLDKQYEEAIEALGKAIETNPSYYVRAHENMKKVRAAVAPGSSE